MSEIEQLQKENDLLRAMLPALSAPCAYCGLMKISECKHGFPGCPQADDIMCGQDETMRRLLEENRALKRGGIIWKTSAQTPPDNTLVLARYGGNAKPFVTFHMSGGNYFRDPRQCDSPDDIPGIVRPNEWALMDFSDQSKA